MSKTSIEWTQHSLNPIRARRTVGVKANTTNSGQYCEKISQGCARCYSSRMQPRFGLPQFQEARGSDQVEHFFDAQLLEQVLRRKKPTKWFWCDMTDMFGRWVPFEWIAACFGVMAATPQHTHQVLTKRPERAVEFFAWLKDEVRGAESETLTEVELGLHYAHESGDGSQEDHDRRYDALVEQIRDGYRPARDEMPWPLPNVHLGVSCENQRAADERIPLLLRCPAAVHWVSAEPLLEPIGFHSIPANLPTLSGEVGRADYFNALDGSYHNSGGDYGSAAPGSYQTINWCVIGGESGGGARPFDLMWARRLVTDFRDANVPIFVKQLGKNPSDDGKHLRLKNTKGGDMSEWPREIRVREFPIAR